MEPSFDLEDMAIFNKSLQLLHSSSIDSELELLKFAHKSIRKYHPLKSNRLKKFPKEELRSNEIRQVDMCVKAYDILAEMNNKKLAKLQIYKKKSKLKLFVKSSFKRTAIEDVQAKLEPEPASLSQRDPRINREPAQLEVHGINTRDPRIKATAQPHVTNKIVTYAKTCPFGKNRVAHTPLPLNSSFPSPVNLRKIRAVLARGDPFPMHLTRTCINNITPDLQREKL